MRDPDACRGGMRTRDGGTWLLAGRERRENPRHTTPKIFFHIARLWGRCRAGMGGLAALPEAGGINQQSAWLIAAFGVLDTADHELEEAEKGGGG